MVYRNVTAALIGCLISLAIGLFPATESVAGKANGGNLPVGLPQPLQLDDALHWAQIHNIELRAAQSVIEQHLGQQIHASGPVPSNPVIEAQAGPRSTPGDNGTDISISISQEFWIGGQGGLQRRAAESRTESAQLQLEYLRIAIRARTRQAFLNLLASKEAVSTAGKLLELTQEVHNYAKRRLDAGQGTQLESNASAIGAGRAQAALALAIRDETRAQLALTELLTIDPAQSLVVEGNLDPRPLQIEDSNQLLNRSVQRRDDLTAAAHEVVAAQQELKLSRRLLIPNLTVFGFYDQENSTDDIFGAGISIPIPLLHRFGGERKESAAHLQQAQIKRDALLLTIRREVLQAIADYRAAREQVSILSEETLAAAEQNVNLTRIAFQAGRVGAPAITTAQDNLFNVRQEYLDALNNLIVAGTTLERATGGLLVMQQAAQPTPRTTN